VFKVLLPVRDQSDRWCGVNECRLEVLLLSTSGTVSSRQGHRPRASFLKPARPPPAERARYGTAPAVRSVRSDDLAGLEEAGNALNLVWG